MIVRDELPRPRTLGARFEKPRRFFFVEHLQRTAAAKLRRLAIRDELLRESEVR